MAFTNTSLPIPRYVSFNNWANSVNLVLDKGGIACGNYSEENWKIWADLVVRLPNFSGYSPPDPKRYSNWQSWANDLLRTIY